MEEIEEVLSLFAQDVKRLMGTDLKKILLYGSYARGDYREDSDIDIMILTSMPESEIEQIENSLYDIAFDYLMEYGVVISVILKNEEHFKYWLGALPFYDNVNREGVVVGG